MAKPLTREQIYLDNLFFMNSEAALQTSTPDGPVAKGLEINRSIYWRDKLFAELDAYDAAVDSI